MNSKPRLHIIGARGQLGRHLVEICQNDFDVLSYSSKSIESKHGKDADDVRPLDAAPLQVQTDEPVIFLSHSNNHEDAANLKELLSQLIDQKPHLIYISTLAVYSSYASVYAEIKNEFETLVQTFEHFSIIRLGFVHGRSFGGMSQIFNHLAKKRLLVLPGDRVKTGFITLPNACDGILQAAKNGPSEAITDHYQTFLSLTRAIDLFGFRGKFIPIPFPTFEIIRRLAQMLRPITPHFIQSFLSITFIDNSAFPEKNGQHYLRCFLMADYVRLFGHLDLWQLRKYIRTIEQKNTLSQYLDLNKKERFLFLYRLKEMLQVERDQR